MEECDDGCQREKEKVYIFDIKRNKRTDRGWKEMRRGGDEGEDRSGDGVKKKN